MGCIKFIIVIIVSFFLTVKFGFLGFIIAIILNFVIMSTGRKEGVSIPNFELLCPLCGKANLTGDENVCSCPACNTSFRYNKLQLLFYKTLYSILAKMAKADGAISQSEANLINQFLDNSLQLDSEEKKIAKVIFTNAKNDGLSIYQHAEILAQLNQPDISEILYRLLWDIASADGKLDANEEEILRNLPLYLNISPSRYNEYKRSYGNGGQRRASTSINLQECYEILGCSPEDSNSTIKKKYKKKIAEFHPDKIQSKGLPPEFVKFANEQMQKINKAYETVMKERRAR